MIPISEPAVAAALVAAGGLITATVFTALSTRRENRRKEAAEAEKKRQETAIQGVGALITGYGSMHQAAMSMAAQWRAELEKTEQECERRIAKVEQDCAARIAALHAEIDKREMWFKERISRMEETLRRLGVRIDSIGENSGEGLP